MKDETDPSAGPTPDTAPPRRKVTVLRLVGGALVITVVTCVVAVSLRPVQKVVWLKPETAFRTNSPGPLSRLKDKLVSLPVIAPIWQRYHPKPAFRFMSLQTFGFSPTNQSQVLARLGAPDGTSDRGVRVWILSPPSMLAESDELLTSAARVVTISLLGLVGPGPKTQTDGLFTITAAAATLPGSSTPRTSGPAQTNSGPTQLTLRLTAKKLAAQTGDRTLMLRTNLDFACQVIVPDDGALVVDYGASPGPEQQHDWLIIFPRPFILSQPTNDIFLPRTRGGL